MRAMALLAEMKAVCGSHNTEPSPRSKLACLPACLPATHTLIGGWTALCDVICSLKIIPRWSESAGARTARVWGDITFTSGGCSMAKAPRPPGPCESCPDPAQSTG
mmetsp:Transcript_4143/g.7696  ORF Transcript_4143/g.7696 Transcript_4143/m.7696 type:complete len:106 (-) Transcript_4143:258-575(-)